MYPWRQLPVTLCAVSFSADLRSRCTTDCKTRYCWTESDGKSHGVQLKEHCSERFLIQQGSRSILLKRMGDVVRPQPLHLTLLSFCT